MVRSLVLGGCGFIGSHIVDALREAGHEVRVADVRPIPPELAGRWRDVEFARADMLDSAAVQDAVRGCTYVFQYATTTIPRTSIADPELDSQNLVGTLRLIKACASSGVEKIVFPSSGGTVYGRPDRLPIPEDAPLRPGTPYAATKIAIEHQLAVAHHLHELNYAVLRYGNPYGPRQSPSGSMGIVSVFLGALKRGDRPTLYGDGGAVKDFFFVGDAAAAAVAVLRDSEEKVFNVASGRGTSIRDLLTALEKATGRGIEPKKAPPLPGDEPACVLDISRIRRVHGWAPRVGLEEGLRRTWDWVRSLPD